jgi:RND family efflux transporter MFP subunit
MTTKRWMVAAALVIVAIAVVWVWSSRSASEAEGGESASSAAGGATAEGAVPAAVTRATRRDLGSTLTISGAFKPFQDVDVHAKVAGYIRAIYVDVGTHVKTGQTLAVLEVPELAAQLSGTEAAVQTAAEQIRRAQGDLSRAQSSQAAVHSAYARLKQAADSQAGLVAQQEVDDSQAKDLAGAAQVQSAEAELSAAKHQMESEQANQKEYAALSGYTRITAPFDGVITNRYQDTGALVAAGTANSTTSTPVVRLAEISVLRLVLPIPESIAGQIHLGQPIKVRVQALNQDFVGKVSRFADELNQQTRTMETEVDFQNKDGKLLPGMFVQAEVSHDEKKNALTVPVESVRQHGDNGAVFVVDAQNTVEEKHVKLGQSDGTRIEIISGLNEGERVIVGHLSEYRTGEKVQPKELADEGGGGSSGDGGSSGAASDSANAGSAGDR